LVKAEIDRVVALAPRYRSGFTLIELLAVILIMAIMLGIGVIAVNSLNKASAVSSGGRGVLTACEMARQYALTHRTYVRVVFPYKDTKSGTSGGTAGQLGGDVRYVSYSVMASNIAWQPPFVSWQYLPAYENLHYLPAGSVFPSGSNAVGALDLLSIQVMPWKYLGRPSFTYTNTSSLATNISYDGIVGLDERFAYIEFNPRGFSSRTLTVSVVQGSTLGWDTTASTAIVAGVDRAWIIVDKNSGRVRLERK
jgi:prepilin-type N-terminal cleavage/methylation domain-containing protein